MSSARDHVAKYQHNMNFLRFGISNVKFQFYDWEVVAHFYAALHIIETVLAERWDEHSDDHNSRRELMLDHPEVFTRECFRMYSSLKAAANRARYDTVETTSEDVRDAQKDMEYIAEIFHAYLGE